MPLYEFECPECGHQKEKWVSVVNRNDPNPCPACQEDEMVRKISAPTKVYHPSKS